MLKNDASDPGAVAELAKVVREKWDGIDGRWLNAGYGKFRPNQKNDADFFDR